MYKMGFVYWRQDPTERATNAKMKQLSTLLKYYRMITQSTKLKYVLILISDQISERDKFPS